MIVWFLCQLIGRFSGLPEAVLTLDERSSTNPDHAVSYPYDAVYHRDHLYVADDGSCVLVFDAEGTYVRTIGRRGQGPGELEHAPVSLVAEGDTLVVTEMYGYSRSRFTLAGRFLTREKIEGDVVYHGDMRFRKLTRGETLDHGDTHLVLGADCTCNRLEGAEARDLHLARAIFREISPGRFLAVKRRGTVEIYGRGCVLEKTIEFNVDRFKRELVEDPLATQLMAKVKDERHPYYQFGVPVFDASVESPEALWLLVENEQVQSVLRKPTETWLYRIDLRTEAVSFRQLEGEVTGLRITDGKIVLIAQEEATVRVYELDEMTEAFLGK